MEVRAATMAGEPKPWVIMEKWVRWRCMLGSRMGWGRVLQRGDRSWFSRSISSFVTILKERERNITLFVHPVILLIAN
jgi:hypothetical protein